MAKIVGVHGIGQQYKGEHTLHAEWLRSLKDGLARADCVLTADEDFTCAFYGDLFRTTNAKSAALAPSLNARDVDHWFEQELLYVLWNEAALLDPTVRKPDESTKLSTPRTVQRALDALSHSRFFAGIATRLMIADLKQVRQYIHDADIRQQVLARIVRSVDNDTRVIVAHSLGSLVAYEALCAHPEWPVRVFITIGSPLGIRNIVFDALEPAPKDSIGEWPTGIEHWINIADKSDVVALSKALALRFGSGVKDYLVDNGVKAHDVARYLTTRELGDAVALAL